MGRVCCICERPKSELYVSVYVYFGITFRPACFDKLSIFVYIAPLKALRMWTASSGCGRLHHHHPM